MQTLVDEQTEAILAEQGGPAAVSVKLPPRQRWGEAERIQLNEMLEQSSLFYWDGPQTTLLVERFKKHYPLKWVMPCSSGTAAVHIAVAAAGVGPGDEVITAPITDMGSVIGVLYQQGVPVFADLDPHTYNLDPADVRRKITSKTRAVIAVHLAGNPCDLDALKAICDERGVILIEDCAQAWGSEYRGRPIGTTGHIGCWSLNDFKHIGCGDGGIVASSDKRFGPLLQKFGDKSYTRGGGQRFPDALAPNYRFTEPQAAIAAAQMERMWEVTGERAQVGRTLNELLADTPGIDIPGVDARDRWTCWFYLLRLTPGMLSCDNKEFVRALNAEGIPSGAGYTACPLYAYPVFQEHNFFAGRWPVKELGLTDMDYRKVCCPEAEAILNSCVQVLVNETNNDPSWLRQAATAIKKVAAHYRVDASR